MTRKEKEENSEWRWRDSKYFHVLFKYCFFMHLLFRHRCRAARNVMSYIKTEDNGWWIRVVLIGKKVKQEIGDFKGARWTKEIQNKFFNFIKMSTPWSHSITKSLLQFFSFHFIFWTLWTFSNKDPRKKPHNIFTIYCKRKNYLKRCAHAHIHWLEVMSIDLLIG